MAKITVNNPKNVINSKIGKNYFKLVGTGGPKGDKGDKGDTGAAATISAGTASSLPAGSSPTVTNSGTSSAAVFNFGIPKGDKGDKGDTGATGAAATITVGSTTTGAAGTNASVTNSGTSGAAVLNFTIPRGDKGETGATGATGQAATIAVGSTTTLAPGSSATVTNSGTSSAATFNFGIPQGVKGDTGSVKSTVVSELPESGNSDTFYLVDREATTGTASGTFITIDNPEPNGEISDYDILGNAEQTTYSGKNLCYDVQLQGTNNIRFYINKPSGSSFTISATINVATSNNSLYLFVDGTDYGIAGTLSGSANTRQTRTLTPSPTQLEAIQNGSEIYLLLYKNNAGFTLPTNAMVENGSTATAYEPYVGGTASPNPDYPQTVNTTTGENVVKITGKNLFSGFDTLATGSTYADGVLTISSPSSNISNNIPVFANTAYCLKWTTANQSRVYIREYDASNTQISDKAKYSPPYSFTTSATASYVKIYFSPSTSESFPVTVTNIQLELGSTATTYEPYQAQELEVNLGKNLLPITDQSFTLNGITYSVQNGSLYMNGNSTGEIYSSNNAFKTNFAFTLQAGTYTFSLPEAEAGITSYIDNTASATHLATVNGNTIKSASFTLSEPTAVHLGFYIYNAHPTNKQMLLQLERGSTATTYAPYFTPIELAKIGTYQDRIYKNDGKWYVEKQIGKVVVDATNVNNWALNNTTYSIPMMRTDKNILGIPVTWDSGIVLMNRYSETSSTNNIYSGAFTTNFQKGYLITFNNAFTDEETGRNTLIGTEIYYALATPTTTEITEQALIDQLDALLAAELYSGQNNISSTSAANLAGTLDITYAFFDKTNRHKVYIWSNSDNTWQIIVQ